MPEFTREFLEEVYRLAKKTLPGWAYATLRAQARAVSGGRAAHRTDIPNVFEKVSLGVLNSESMKDLSDVEVKAIWDRLNQWHANALKKKGPTDVLVTAARSVFDIIQDRNIKFKSSPLCDLLETPDNIPDVKKLVAFLPMTGPDGASIAFVGASPSKIEIARNEPYVGPIRKTFESKYLVPLEVARDEVILGYACPEAFAGEKGKVREPTDEEIAIWKDWLFDELDKARPQIVIALGQTARKALGDRADFVMPHPSAVDRFGDSGEVARKIKRIKEALSDIEKADLGAKWFEIFPKSGKGKFSYQHHWRGLSEDETKLSDKELLATDHSLHGDLRLGGDKGLWGWTIFLGETKENRGKDGDKFISMKPGGSLRVTPKTIHPEEWLRVGSQLAGQINKPGEPGSGPESHSKFFVEDSGTYELGVATEHSIEIFLDGKHLNGKYLLIYPRLGGERVWLIDKPKSQTPRAEEEKLADVISEQRKKGRQYVVWAKPGMKPVLYNTRSGEVVKGEMIPISKADPLKKIVYGIVADPYGVRGAQADAHDDWMMPSTVEGMAHDYIGKDMVIGFQHNKKADACPVESWVEQYPSPEDYLKAMKGEPHKVYRRKFGDDVIHSGSWGLGVRLGEKEWGAYEKGEINAFSPGGLGLRTPITPSQMPKVEFIDLVPKGI